MQNRKVLIVGAEVKWGSIYQNKKGRKSEAR
jgi:hypothetical protein